MGAVCVCCVSCSSLLMVAVTCLILFNGFSHSRMNSLYPHTRRVRRAPCDFAPHSQIQTHKRKRWTMSDSLQGFGEPSNGLWAAINTADHLREMGGAKGKFWGGGEGRKLHFGFLLQGFRSLSLTRLQRVF